MFAHRDDHTRQAPDARRAIHVALTSVILWFAFVLSRPGDTFAASYSFDAMSHIMTEEHWAGLFGLLGAVGVAGYKAQRQWLWRTSVLAMSTGHGAIAFCFAVSGIGHPLLPGAGVYATMAGLGYYLVWRSVE